MESHSHQLVQEKVKKLVDRIQGLPTLPVMMTNINGQLVYLGSALRVVKALTAAGMPGDYPTRHTPPSC